ncbi:MAG: ATP-binding protein [Dehalococcoidia bacterium]
MKQLINVLEIEDNPGDARLIQEMLVEAKDARFHVERADRLAAGLDRLSGSEFDVLLLDLGLPDGDGIGTFLQAQAQGVQVPIVVLTGTNDDVLALQAVQLGAQDYLVKGSVDSDSLSRCIRYAIERQRLLSELETTAAELEFKNTELDAFARTVSHDLKEPLRAVQAFSQFLMEDYWQRLDAQGRDYLTLISRASERMKRLIESLLTLSRVGEDIGPPMRVELTQVIQNVLEDNTVAMMEKDVNVQVSDSLPAVRGDQVRLEHIFANLLGNALKFNKNANPTVEIGVRKIANGVATLFVRDDGIGIDSQYHERIFGVFQRLHRREDFEGTGAGLSIVKRAVESLGGQVWVESELGAGATFLFTVPIWVEPDDQAENEDA